MARDSAHTSADYFRSLLCGGNAYRRRDASRGPSDRWLSLGTAWQARLPQPPSARRRDFGAAHARRRVPQPPARARAATALDPAADRLSPPCSPHALRCSCAPPPPPRRARRRVGAASRAVGAGMRALGERRAVPPVVFEQQTAVHHGRTRGMQCVRGLEEEPISHVHERFRRRFLDFSEYTSTTDLGRTTRTNSDAQVEIRLREASHYCTGSGGRPTAPSRRACASRAEVTWQSSYASRRTPTASRGTTCGAGRRRYGASAVRWAALGAGRMVASRVRRACLGAPAGRALAAPRALGARMRCARRPELRRLAVQEAVEAARHWRLVVAGDFSCRTVGPERPPRRALVRRCPGHPWTRPRRRERPASPLSASCVRPAVPQRGRRRRARREFFGSQPLLDRWDRAATARRAHPLAP